jgi:hypothetical protein
MTDEAQIAAFLEDVKRAERIVVIDTEKNKITRYELGITVSDQEEIIRNLTPSDYHRGPVEDHDPEWGGLLWVFKQFYRKSPLYIKIKEMEIIDHSTTIKCLSCHIDYM